VCSGGEEAVNNSNKTNNTHGADAINFYIIKVHVTVEH